MHPSCIWDFLTSLLLQNSKKFEGDPSGPFTKNKNYEQRHSAQQCKIGTLRDFLTFILLQNIKKIIEEETIW